MGKQAAFKTNPVSLEELLRHCGSGKIQLPDFQRSWVWDEERIKGLIASISQAFPVGALMTLEVKPGAADTFARRPIQGADIVATAAPDQLLLDGQQRMTSLYQTCLRREVVQTVTPRLKLVKRWFYIDIRKAMNPSEDRENAIVSVPEDRRIKSDFDRKIELDLSTPELEYQNLMFPLNQVFDWDEWQDGFNEFWLEKDPETRKLFKPFKDEVLQNFKAYQLPVIALGPDTSHEAVCLVFEKVNTGGKPLDAFELVTAMYAARGHRLRDDWLGADGQAGLRTRLSAAYKGIHALLMAEGAIDFRSGQPYGQTVFFDEYVDIHHIFPQDWCKKQKIEPKVFDTVANKTPLSYKTNRILGGVAPSEYLSRLEKGGRDTPPIAPDALDEYLASHAMDPALLRADDFEGFMADREARLLAMIAKATGHPVIKAGVAPEEGEDIPQDDEGFDLPDAQAEEAA